MLISEDEFPLVFKHGKPFYGFEVGSGWIGLLRETFGRAEKFLQNNPQYQNDFKLLQIKSRFGCLRIYTIGAPEDLAEIFRKAEDVSYNTCEVCGDTAETEASDNYMTLCLEHDLRKNQH